MEKMNLILDEQNDDWFEMGPEFEELRQGIRTETRESISRAEIEYKGRHREQDSGVVG